jgi:3-dehydroquinate dehydratase-1
MQTVTVRGVEIGSGIPKICAPVVGKTLEDVLSQAKALADLPVDLCEWRIDHLTLPLSQPETKSAVAEMLPALREALGETPLLVTFRTKAEGGEQSASSQAYSDLLCHLAATGLIDLLDVELSQGQAVFHTILTCAHENGVKVVASNHDFHATPAKEEIKSRLARMEEWGADIAKIAVMPQSEEDVATLLTATQERHQEAQIPLITMSMSQLGMFSRKAGELFGSSVTFGSAAAASAPGQIQVEELHEILLNFHRLAPGELL